MNKPTLKILPNSVIAPIEDDLPQNDGLFGLKPDPTESSLMVLGASWGATASYGLGAANTPANIILPSCQIDLDDPHFGDVYRFGIAYEILESLPEWNQLASTHAAQFRSGQYNDSHLAKIVNEFSTRVSQAVEKRADAIWKKGAWVGVLGGDHSVPLGLLRSLNRHISDNFGIIHIDAHHDLRIAYEGFEQSHASIMHNILEDCPKATKLVQIGIRDFCADERNLVLAQPERIQTYYDHDIATRLDQGQSFIDLVNEMIDGLPQQVYISFDIDGLDPTLCPSTGTPVPGGLSFYHASTLLLGIVRSGRQIIGFDLCEVGCPLEGDWDHNVGARILYKLCGSLLRSQEKNSSIKSKLQIQ